MTKKICVYTCITGNYDHLHELEHPEKNIHYYCFTNNPKLKSNTWTIINIKNEGLDNCRLARKIKILGHPTVNQYDIAVWSDADVVWQKPITEFIKKYFKDTSFSIFKHHARNNIHDEAIACLRCRKDSKDSIEKNLKFYKSVNFPDNNGLCESTVFIKHPKDPKVIKTMEEWFNMVKTYSRRDQLSFNYAVWKTNLKVTYIPLVVWENPWFYIAKHTPNSNNDTCHVYYGNPEQNFDFNKYQIYPYNITNHTYHFDAIIPENTKEIEFNPSNIIGTEFGNLIINPSPNHTDTYGAITINNQKTFFCNDHGIIHAYADFKKGQKLSFSIDMHTPTISVLNKIIEHQWSYGSMLISNLRAELVSLKNANASLQNDNINLQNNIEDLNRTLTELHTNYNNIINSKGWRALEKLRKLRPSSK